jgi:pimeloyl-ACP methyl ester carboxylesterase
MVVSATLTGLGERAHLLSPDVTLDTHVSDIVALLKYRDLQDIVLVGHSYGGTVITATAEQATTHIRALVYLDASVPRDGESNNDVLGRDFAVQLRRAAELNGGGWSVPPPPLEAWGLPDDLRSWVETRVTPHPLRTLEDPVRLGSEAAASLPRVFLRSSTRSTIYARLIAQARDAGWLCRELRGGHYPMLTEPETVSAALAELPSHLFMLD